MSVTYRIGDVRDVLAGEPADSAAFIHLDDAWARPKRGNAFGVEYPTHPFSADADHVDGDPDLTVRQVLAECLRVCEPGGTLVVDADSWLLPRLVEYLADRLGPDQYATGSVTALASDGTPDRSTPGQYLASGGYPVVLASPGACPVQVPTHQPAPRQREQYGWGTAKPLGPYRAWLAATTVPGDRVLVPCAGTAPTAIAAELDHGDRADVLAIDIEPDAKAAYERRRADELARQETLGTFAGGSA
ncbi:hypothetical protein [Halostella litorea]|uniref:hypothetical protein n=1 Tax=Halostella litorea TaxID=2528831 RepID=UPI001092766F|nr:hypothetical protein [Halostella litorea]